MGEALGETVLEYHIERLLSKGVLIRCGVTPTDAMHFKRDFEAYNRNASVLDLNIMARILDVETAELAERIYDTFKRKLYDSLLRILVEDSFPEIRAEGMGIQLKQIIDDSYEHAKDDTPNGFFDVAFSTPATLVGVGVLLARGWKMPRRDGWPCRDDKLEDAPEGWMALSGGLVNMRGKLGINRLF